MQPDALAGRNNGLRFVGVFVSTCLLVSYSCAAAASTPRKKGDSPHLPPFSAPAPVTILDIDTHTYYGRWSLDPSAVRTTWRYWETWQTEVVRRESGEGELVRMDCTKPFAVSTSADGKKIYGIQTTDRIAGSGYPAAGWLAPDFDDSTWFRQSVTMREGYRSLALICARGKFNVHDPASAPDLSLSVSFQGGLVAYLNGKEIGRAGLPAGRLD
jgi:hypothetical protein